MYDDLNNQKCNPINKGLRSFALLCQKTSWPSLILDAIENSYLSKSPEIWLLGGSFLTASLLSSWIISFWFEGEPYLSSEARSADLDVLTIIFDYCKD